jgi:hypothetical protein
MSMISKYQIEKNNILPFGIPAKAYIITVRIKCLLYNPFGDCLMLWTYFPSGDFASTPTILLNRYQERYETGEQVQFDIQGTS